MLTIQCPQSNAHNPMPTIQCSQPVARDLAQISLKNPSLQVHLYSLILSCILTGPIVTRAPATAKEIRLDFADRQGGRVYLKS
jgi:hypothetical protein